MKKISTYLMLLFLGLEVNIHAMEKLPPKPAVELDIFLGGDRKYVVKNAKETEYQSITYKCKNQKDNLQEHTKQLASKLPWLLASSQLKDLKEGYILEIALDNQRYMLTAKQKAFENNKDQNSFEEIFKKLNSGTDCYKIDLDVGINGLNNIDKIEYIGIKQHEYSTSSKVANSQIIAKQKNNFGLYTKLSILAGIGLALYLKPSLFFEPFKFLFGGWWQKA